MSRLVSMVLVGSLFVGLLLMGCDQATPTPSPTPTATPTPRETIYSWDLDAVKETLNSRVPDLSWTESIGIEGDIFESGDFDYGYFGLIDSANLVIYLLASTPESAQVDILNSLFIAAGYGESEAKYLSESQVEGQRTLSALERSGFRAYGYVIGSSATMYYCMAPGKVGTMTLSDMYAGDPTFSKLSILVARSSPDWEAAEPC